MIAGAHAVTKLHFTQNHRRAFKLKRSKYLHLSGLIHNAQQRQARRILAPLQHHRMTRTTPHAQQNHIPTFQSTHLGG